MAAASSSSSSDKTEKAITPAGYPDYKEYVVAVDVRAYHFAFTQLTGAHRPAAAQPSRARAHTTPAALADFCCVSVWLLRTL